MESCSVTLCLFGYSEIDPALRLSLKKLLVNESYPHYEVIGKLSGIKRFFLGRLQSKFD